MIIGRVIWLSYGYECEYDTVLSLKIVANRRQRRPLCIICTMIRDTLTSLSYLVMIPCLCAYVSISGAKHIGSQSHSATRLDIIEYLIKIGHTKRVLYLFNLLFSF